MGRQYDTSQTVDFHWRSFLDFCRYEMAAGGPDSYLGTVGAMTARSTPDERVWQLGCFIGVFSAPTAELLWQRWPLERMRRSDIGVELEQWLRDNWSGLHIRKERRPVKSPARLAEYMIKYAEWARRRFTSLLVAENFETVWDTVGEIRYVGRYAQIKMCEAFKRYAGVRYGLSDLRAKGGWSPRLGLAYLYPRYAEMLVGKESWESVELTETLGAEVRAILEERLKRPIDMYRTEVLLCNYKQAWHGRQYPGWSQDFELDHLRTVQRYWGAGYQTDMLRVRRELFDPRVLGELSGWDGVRKELTAVLRDHGYTWSDTVYNYGQMTDVARPPRWT